MATATIPATAIERAHPWWRGAAIYQIYPRSFMDANGDGIGDLQAFGGGVHQGQQRILRLRGRERGKQQSQAEGQAAAALVHPNVVTTHAVGEADGFWFLEMEFVAGGSLQHLLVSDSTLSISAATRLALDIAAGVEHVLDTLGTTMAVVDGTCTSCDERYWSHRGTGTTRRQGMVAWIQAGER